MRKTFTPRIYKIYALIDPRDEMIKYIGLTSKTLDKRLHWHLKSAHKKNKKSNWIEASDRLEEILYEKDIPYITDIETVKKLFKTDKIEWLNDRGKYRREVHVNKYSIETVFGKPKI